MEPPVLWRPASPPTNGHLESSTDERRAPLQRHLDEEREFRRIRSLRLDDLRARPNGVSWTPHALVIRTPSPKPLGELVGWGLPLGQELAHAAFTLAVHGYIVVREDNAWNLAENSTWALLMVSAALCIVGYCNRPQNGEEMQKKGSARISNETILVLKMCFVSRLLHALTATHRAGAIYAGAITGIAIHLLPFAYGTTTRKPLLFAMMLLASTLKSFASSCAFATLAATPFALCSAPRNSTEGSFRVKIIVACSLGACLLLPPVGKAVFGSLQLLVMLASPLLQWRLQKHKRIITGPWDIAHIRVPK